MKNNLNVTGTRSILTTVDEYRAAVAEIATRAQRGLAIYTPDLEPQLYDHDLFLEPMKRLVLARSHARVRVLISDPGRVVREGNRFLQMARRLTSYLDLRNVSSEFRGNPCAFIVADDRAIAYRQQASRWDGIVDFDDVNVVRRYMTYFELRDIGAAAAKSWLAVNYNAIGKEGTLDLRMAYSALAPNGNARHASP